MNYYVTDNTGASVALNDIPEVSYAAFYEDLRVKPAPQVSPPPQARSLRVPHRFRVPRFFSCD